MQRFTLLLSNLSTTGITQVSNLELIDDYYVYRQQNGGGIVDEFNVKTFLDDPDNAIISSKFFSFLTGNTNVIQYREIFYDNKKLSNIFNKFYSTSIVSNETISTSVINLELTGTTQINAKQFNYLWNGQTISHFPYMNGIPNSIQNSSLNTINRNELITITNEDSYYVDIHIDFNNNLINKINFSEYTQDFYQKKLRPKTARWGSELTGTMVEFIKKVRPDVNGFFSGNHDQIRKWYDIYGRIELPWGTITMEQIANSDTTTVTKPSLGYSLDLTPKMIKRIRKGRPDVNKIFSRDIDIKKWFEIFGKKELPWSWGGVTTSLDDILLSDSIFENKLIKHSFVDINLDDDVLKEWDHIYRSPDQVAPTGEGIRLSFYTNINLDFLPEITQINNPGRLIVTNIGLNGWGRDFSDNFFLRFAGYFYAPVPAIYTFKLESDDGSSLYIGDYQIIKNDGIHGSVSSEGMIGLLPGLHRIDVRYFEKGGGENLIFSYKINNGNFITNPILYYQ